MCRPTLENREKIFAVAPMMDWTDRHCRFFHRQLTRNALLYSEMVTADAVIHGDRDRLLGFSKDEMPLALQLGGCDPQKLAVAAKAGENWGYNEINLNVGCPSDRVQNGTFGACLMTTPALVGDCVAAMREVVSVPVTVKCRLGVDDQDIERALDDLANHVLRAPVDAIWVHARKAWLQGLSPKENRDIPPLDYDRVYRLKQRLPQCFIGINGGIASVEDAKRHLNLVDGVMLGRAAYQNASILLAVDGEIYGAPTHPVDWQKLIRTMEEYADAQMARGERLSAITRHMIGLFSGIPGARRYRQILSEEARLTNADPSVIARAFAAVDLSHVARAA
ncbi:MAG: tRNA dihydrouridine(20/20a) synthase DusA [Pseudomonadota bacterium]